MVLAAVPGLVPVRNSGATVGDLPRDQNERLSGNPGAGKLSLAVGDRCGEGTCRFEGGRSARLFATVRPRPPRRLERVRSGLWKSVSGAIRAGHAEAYRCGEGTCRFSRTTHSFATRETYRDSKVMRRRLPAPSDPSASAGSDVSAASSRPGPSSTALITVQRTRSGPVAPRRAAAVISICPGASLARSVSRTAGNETTQGALPAWVFLCGPDFRTYVIRQLSVV